MAESTTRKAQLKIKLIYFKESGKSYDEAHFWKIFEGCIQPEEAATVVAPMYAVCAEVRRLNETRQLPGLASGSWDGPILVTCKHGYPCLLFPRGTPKPIRDPFDDVS